MREIPPQNPEKQVQRWTDKEMRHSSHCNCSSFSHQVCDWPWFHATHGKGRRSHCWNERSWCGDCQECDFGRGPVGHHPGRRCGRVERSVFSGNLWYLSYFKHARVILSSLKTKYGISKHLSCSYICFQYSEVLPEGKWSGSKQSIVFGETAV